MQALNFDALKFVKNLTAHGFTQEQAEVLADEHIALLNSNLATKQDIEELRHEITKAKLQAIIWVVGLLVAQTGILVSALKF